MSITRRFSKFAVGPCDAPKSALRMMRLSVFDWAACGMAGAGEPVSVALRDMVLAEGGTGAAQLIGGGRASMRGAALVNGAVSHALDYDDTHFAHIGHPSVAVVPAALAVAEDVEASGVAFLEAALIGVEVSIRVGLWLGRDHYQTGFHQTATAGCFGAAAAAGRLLGCDADQMAHALGLAATKAAGLKSQFGTMGKPYNAGQAAAAGVEVALLARKGFVSNPEGLESAQGFGPTHHGAGDMAALDGLGADWQFETVSHKFHACCHGTHAMIEALLGLRDRVRGEVTRIEVRTHPRWLRVCDVARPETGLEAKFSYRLIAAMVLAGYDTAALDSFSDANAQDAGLAAVRDRVEVSPDDDLTETAASVLLHLTDGTTLQAEVDISSPIPLETREAKLRGKVEAMIGAQIKTVSAAVLDGAGPDIPALSDCLGG